MFAAMLRLGWSSLHYFHSHRRVLYGKDLYRDAVTDTTDIPADLLRHEMGRQRLRYSIELHRLHLYRLKPLLPDLVTFHCPRLRLLADTGSAPATSEEAVHHYSRLDPAAQNDLPRRFAERFGGMDLNGINHAVAEDDFDRALPWLSAETAGKRGSP
jgi:hypothetical protein